MEWDGVVMEWDGVVMEWDGVAKEWDDVVMEWDGVAMECGVCGGVMGQDVTIVRDGIEHVEGVFTES